jgi:hemoglobin/transferrin/lactoferrin receptor protein
MELLMRKKWILIFVCLLGMSIFLMSETGTVVTSNTSNQEKEEESSQKQKEKEKVEKKEKVNKKDEGIHHEIMVTATRTEKDIFEIPNPASIVSHQKILEQAPNNITELFFDIPGVDINGVGPNQSRPVIRGLRGQRILLLEDGIRMNSPRRQQDFGEIPAIVDVAGIERVEVVRGPASVLYGSDAIGGVVNIITQVPDYGFQDSKIHGNIGYRFSSADSQHKGSANLSGNFGNLGFMLSGTYRNAGSYEAPAGSFGDIDLADDTVINDSGVEDKSLNLFIGFRLLDNHDFSFKYEYYNSEDAGFGYVDPELYDPGSARIKILYPFQRTNKFSLSYENRALNFLFADGVSLTGYYINNRRQLDMNIFVPFGIPGLPDAGVEIRQENFTDLRTHGLRLEMTKVYLNRHILTYGVDYVHDNSQNTDSSSTQMVGFGNIPPSLDNTPQLPFATYRSLGAFLQDDVSLSSRSSLILGVRYQSVKARTKETPGLESEPLVNSQDQTLVGAANLTYGLSDKLRFVAAIGRGFRSPNLIERFFNGPTPEGSAYQSRNLDLKAETSFNVDLGTKYRNKNIYFEATYFFNTIYDGIRISPTGNMINSLPEYRNVNIDKLRVQGIEALVNLKIKFGLSITTNFTHLTSKDLGNPELPFVDTYSSKLNFYVRYDSPKDLFWIEYHLRTNGDQKDIDLGNNPIGPIIPGFTVHNLRAGITLFKKSSYAQRVGIIVGNLTNTLYSEFSNASFFRPAPKRHFSCLNTM